MGLFKKKSLVDVLESETPVQQEIDTSSIDVDNVRLDNMNILLVEDNVLNREIAEYLLTSKGAKVDFAENGKIAVAKFLDSLMNYYDCILMDIVMPTMDGYEATKYIRKSKHPDAKNIPIIAMTAKNLEADIQYAYKCGMNAFVLKPINTAVLLGTIQKYRKK
ncbi:MAG: response regulator [Bacilli bacterium]|nr:response regulator [Bacilli bacterium]